MKYVTFTISFLLFILLICSCGTESAPVYTLTTTCNPVEGGSITPQSGSFEEGEVVSLQATPAEGWLFSRWEQDLNTTANPMTITMNRDYNVVGVFEKRYYPLNINTEGEGSVDERLIQQKSTEYPHGSVVELTAIPAEGWEFVRWEGDLQGNENPQTIAITQKKAVTAVFERDFHVVSATGRIWMDRNLGASRAATSITDVQAYGDLFQWGRNADGHQLRNSLTTTTLSSSDQPGHDNFIITASTPYDWRRPQNDILWQGVNGINNPCPEGYRLPSEAEWEAEIQSWSSRDRAGAFASPLKLPVAGSRSLAGSLNNVDSHGNYWSSTVKGYFVSHLYFNSSDAGNSIEARVFGYSVRCIKD